MRFPLFHFNTNNMDAETTRTILAELQTNRELILDFQKYLREAIQLHRNFIPQKYISKTEAQRVYNIPRSSMNRLIQQQILKVYKLQGEDARKRFLVVDELEAIYKLVEIENSHLDDINHNK